MTSGAFDVPARLFFLLARDANVGVILRRGPSKWVQVIRWDTAHDTFEPGQWFHGRIYEHQTDLSPSGKLMIYFAVKHTARARNSDYKGNWTAISRPPYLTALALWPLGFYAGGGLFETERRVWLSHPDFALTPHPDHLPAGLDTVVPLSSLGKHPSVLFQRMERDGWALTQGGMPPGGGNGDYQAMYFEKPGPDGRSTLLMNEMFGAPIRYSFRFAVRYEQGNIPLENVDWAEWDRNGRLVFARMGKIWAGEIDKSGRLHETELADFNGSNPEPVRAPDWATRW